VVVPNRALALPFVQVVQPSNKGRSGAERSPDDQKREGGLDRHTDENQSTREEQGEAVAIQKDFQNKAPFSNAPTEANDNKRTE
jgi:hypothetical protein